MKKVWLMLLCLYIVAGCNQTNRKGTSETNNTKAVSSANGDHKDMAFDDLYKEIKPADISENVFRLINEEWNIVTAGTPSEFNSMTASWGSFGVIFEKPATFLFLNANRYTLEMIKKHNTYTMSYLDDSYKDQKLFLGSKSGRDSEKMKEVKLTPVNTPSGNMSYKEAHMIIELQLEGLTQFSPEDFKTEDHRKFLIEGKEKGNRKEFHYMVTGIISHVWVRK